jgi:hypothetical protein
MVNFKLLVYFLLEQKETKIQGERPTPIFFSHQKPAQYRRKKL